MTEVYDYGKNSCYDYTSICFDQSQPQQYTVNHPIFNAHNSCLDSQIQLNSTLAKITEQMTSITSLCEMACNFIQKKQEEKRIEEEQVAKAQTWKLSDDDNDEESSNSLNDNIFELPPFSAITPDEPVLSTEEPDNALSMGDEHLDTILVTESDEVIKSGVENLIPIPSESEDLDPKGDMILFESFLNNDPSSDSQTKSSSTSLNSLLEETHTFDNSLPECITFSNVLWEFAGELTLLKSIPPGIDETD
nr:hypothetical protein [Tanacetum cinerariifolium]